jgi:membrane-associated phospholipid phosphatase
MTQTEPEHTRSWRVILAQIVTQLLNAPVVSAVIVTWIMFQLPGNVPGRLAGWGYTLLFLSGIPLLSLLFYIPWNGANWKQVLRRQRVASFAFMAVSYPIGLLVVHLTHAPVVYEAIVTSYVAVVMGLILINKFYKASGHAAGVAGPISALIFLYGWVATPFLALLPLVTWARVRTKGHTVGQIVVGSCLSIACTLAVLGLYGFTPRGW